MGIEPSDEKRDLYHGFGDTLARAFELVATPALFALMGHGLDRWLGTTPVFTIVLCVLAVVGAVARMYYGYKTKMDELERDAPWAKRALP